MLMLVPLTQCAAHPVALLCDLNIDLCVTSGELNHLHCRHGVPGRRRGHEAVAAAADEAVRHIASSRAEAEELRAQQAHREVELTRRCSHLQQQAEQLQDTLQQKLEEAQQKAAARQQQIAVSGS